VTDDRYGDEYERALAAAARWHRDHRRKGSGAPYISHLLTVSAFVWEDGGGQTEAIAALLHDAIEDEKATVDDVRSSFGDDVATLVVDCTETRFDRRGQTLPWFERKVAHVHHLSTVAVADRAVATMRVVGADKLANVNSMLIDHRHDSGVWDHFKGGLGGSVWYLERMAALVAQVVPGSMVSSELDRGVDSLAAILQRESAALGDAPASLTRELADMGELRSEGATAHLAFELVRAVDRQPSEPMVAAAQVIERWLGPAAPGDAAALRQAVTVLTG
jgi:hypothetical protein